MEFSVRALRGWAVPYVVPIAGAHGVFDGEGQVREAAVRARDPRQGGVRVAGRLATDDAIHRLSECEEAADRVASAA
jgi:hypothetical protein